MPATIGPEVLWRALPPRYGVVPRPQYAGPFNGLRRDDAQSGVALRVCEHVGRTPRTVEDTMFAQRTTATLDHSTAGTTSGRAVVPSAGDAHNPVRGRASRAGTVLIGVTAAALGNLMVAALAHAAGASQDFRALHAATFLPLTVIGFLAGAGGWATIRSRSTHPARLLRRVVPAVLLVSFVPDVLVYSGGSMPGTSGGAVLALAVMHVVTAACALPTYQRVLPLPSETPASLEGSS